MERGDGAMASTLRPARRTPARGCAPLLALLLTMVALSGCMRVDRALHLNSDGSGVYTLAVGFREPTPGNPESVSADIASVMEAFGAHVRETGGSYQRSEDTGYAYWTYTRPFATVIKANTLLQEDPSQDDPRRTPVLFRDSLHVAQETRFSSAIFHVTGTISLADRFNNAQSWRDATESLSISMAGGIVAHQGGVRQGATVTYTIHYNETATVDVSGRVAGATDLLFSDARLVLAGSLLTLSVLMFVIGLRLLRRRVKS
jgi:hypothetical protein